MGNPPEWSPPLTRNGQWNTTLLTRLSPGQTNTQPTRARRWRGRTGTQCGPERGAEQGDEVSRVDHPPPPPLLGGLDELEDHGQGCGATGPQPDGGEGRLHRIRGPQGDPVLGREVEDRPQRQGAPGVPHLSRDITHPGPHKTRSTTCARWDRMRRKPVRAKPQFHGPHQSRSGPSPGQRLLRAIHGWYVRRSAMRCRGTTSRRRTSCG